MDKITELTEEQKAFAIDMMTTLVVEALVEELEMDSNRVLSDFILSKTGRLLYDESSKLWWNGPAYIVQMYKEEKETDNI